MNLPRLLLRRIAPVVLMLGLFIGFAAAPGVTRAAEPTPLPGLPTTGQDTNQTLLADAMERAQTLQTVIKDLMSNIQQENAQIAGLNAEIAQMKQAIKDNKFPVAITTTAGTRTSTTKYATSTDLEHALAQCKADLDSLQSQVQLDTIKLQSTVIKYNDTIEMITNLIKHNTPPSLPSMR